MSIASSTIEIRRPVLSKPTRKHEVDDIAEDVRKIKESMKEQEKASSQPITIAPARKSRASTSTTIPKVEKITPKAVKSRTSKRSIKTGKEPSPPVQEPKVEEEEKSKINEELKKELLADWLDEDDVIMQDKSGNFLEIIFDF